MDVQIINYTQDALELLLFTKQTRLALSPILMEEIKSWDDEKKQAELNYMLGTIQSSWEFVDYTFLITGVTRAFTHQLVRHRHASYAQQTQRSINMGGFEYITPASFNEEQEEIYSDGMQGISFTYKRLLENGANRQDARGVLPTNVSTNIIMKVNLRSLHDMMLKRLCVKTQGEAQSVFRLMKEQVVQVHPWVGGFLKVWCAFYGTCCFPSFPVNACPVKKQVHNPVTGKAYDGEAAAPLQEIEEIWKANRAEAQPIV